jgi:hypothetical protein
VVMTGGPLSTLTILEATVSPHSSFSQKKFARVFIVTIRKKIGFNKQEQKMRLAKPNVSSLLSEVPTRQHCCM